MRLDYHKNFKRSYRKLSKKVQEKCSECLMLFWKDPHNPLLRNHALSGEYKGYRSINITADVRALYEPVSQEEAFFVYLGTHSELYT